MAPLFLSLHYHLWNPSALDVPLAQEVPKMIITILFELYTSSMDNVTLYISEFYTSRDIS